MVASEKPRCSCTRAGGVRASHCVPLSMRTNKIMKPNIRTCIKLTSSKTAIGRGLEVTAIYEERYIPELKISRYFSVVLPMF